MPSGQPAASIRGLPAWPRITSKRATAIASATGPMKIPSNPNAARPQKTQRKTIRVVRSEDRRVWKDSRSRWSPYH